MAKPKIKTYANTFNHKPLKAYVEKDMYGNSVMIMPKNPSKHQSEHPHEQHPTCFENLHVVISDPDSIVPPSKTKKSLEDQKTGEIKVFKKNNFRQLLDLPFDCGSDETTVIVYYGNDGKNYTKSYRINPKL